MKVHKKNKRMNIYIDSENVPSSEFQNIMNTYNQYQKSILSIKIYADWSNLQSKKWHECCKKNINVEQIQCITKPHKQSIDINIITDVMNDVLLDKQLKNNAMKHIVIVSSDTDFDPLIKKINKLGIIVDKYQPHKRTLDYSSETDAENMQICEVSQEEKSNYIHKCIRKLKKNRVQCIGTTKLMKALNREAKTIQEINMFTMKNLCEYPDILMKCDVTNKWILQ